MIATIDNGGQQAVRHVLLNGKRLDNVTYADDFNGRVTVLKDENGRAVYEDLTGTVQIIMDKDWCYDYVQKKFIPIKGAA